MRWANSPEALGPERAPHAIRSNVAHPAPFAPGAPELANPVRPEGE